MSNYDFSSLSSHDFESLVRDLLQCELKLTLESFKQGRDRGIDLRYSQPDVSGRPPLGAPLIVQCKHFSSTPYSVLLSQLKQKEAPKVRALSPSRYILATSVGLTPANKDAIVKALSPYCLSTADVFGRDDLNNLLGKFNEIEKQHHKLWLTSTTVLKQIVHSGLFAESAAEQERIEQRLKLYVQNDSFNVARTLLDKHHYCVVVGIPGIGKSVLAEILAIDHLTRGYAVTVVTDDIRKAFKAYDASKKQFFYYDDFLGQTGLHEKLQKNEDQALVRFVEMVRRSKLARLVLTTRDYIFNQAKMTYEKIAQSSLDNSRCVVDLGSYTRPQRAKIFFNHIYFSALPKQYKEALLSEQKYRSILGHANFSPRIIEWMTDISVHDSVPPERYVAEFLANLHKPLRLWEHAFNNQLSNAARHLLLALTTMPDGIHLDDLALAFDSLFARQARRFGFSRDANDYSRALKELESNFIEIVPREGLREGIKQSGLMVRLHNPSIRDFLQDFVNDNAEYVVAICESAPYFEQIVRLWDGFSKVEPGAKSIPSTRAVILRSAEAFWNAVERTSRAPACRASGSEFSSVERRALFLVRAAEQSNPLEAADVVQQTWSTIHARWLEGVANAECMIELLERTPSALLPKDITFEQLVQAAKVSLLAICSESLTDLAPYDAAAFLIETYPQAFTDAEKVALANSFVMYVDEYSTWEHNSTIRTDLTGIESIARALGAELEEQISNLRDYAAEMDAQAEERAEYGYDAWKEDRYLEREYEEEVDEMFAALTDVPDVTI